MKQYAKNSEGWHEVLPREKDATGKLEAPQKEIRKEKEVSKSVRSKYEEVVPAGAELHSFSATVNDEGEVVGGSAAFRVNGSLNVVQF